MAPELLARFIVGGMVVLAAVEALVWVDDPDARHLPLRFKWSAAWYCLRFILILATIILCVVTMESR